MLRTGFEDGCYEHKPRVKSGKDNQWILLKRMLIKGPVPTPYTIISLRLTFCKRRKVSSLLMLTLISLAWDVLILLVFPHDYICAFLIVWKSYHLQFPSHFNNGNKVQAKLKPFPVLTISCCVNSAKPLADTSRNTTSKRPSVCSPNPGFRKFIPRAHSSPCPQEIKSSHSNNIIVITALQRDK